MIKRKKKMCFKIRKFIHYKNLRFVLRINEYRVQGGTGWYA